MTEIEYLLICLAEECNEVAQRATKALRFGLNEIQSSEEQNPDKQNNLQRLTNELIDLYTVIEVLKEKGIHIDMVNKNKIELKKNKIEKYYKYSLGLKSKCQNF